MVDNINEGAESISQQKAAGAAVAARTGKLRRSYLKGAARQMYRLPKDKLLDLARTRHEGLPYYIKENITYTPDMIDEFTITSKKELEDIRKIYNVLKNSIMSITIDDILSDNSTIQSLLEKSKSLKNILDKKHSKYFNIIEPFDFLDAPENVKSLEKNVNELDELLINMYDIIDIFSSFDSIKKSFSRLTN